MDALSDPARHFDASGKLPALLRHRAICETPMALPDGRFGAIAGKKPFQELKLRRLATANDRLRVAGSRARRKGQPLRSCGHAV